MEPRARGKSHRALPHGEILRSRASCGEGRDNKHSLDARPDVGAEHGSVLRVKGRNRGAHACPRDEPRPRCPRERGKPRLDRGFSSAKALIVKSQQLSQPPINREPPLIFVDVSQAQAVVEPPKEAQYYSDKNSLAANPRADVVTGIPKIEGKQTDVPRTEDVPKTDFHPLQPSPAKVEQADKPGEMEKGPPVAASGDLALGKPDPTLKPDTGDKPRGRPRTLKEAMARLPESRIPGPKMHQEGGVRRRLEIASLDAKATPFGAYDKELVEAISQRWFTLLDQRAYASDSRGKVVLRFVLHQDGRVSGMGVMESTTGEVLTLICEKAVLDPAPFAPWPIEMRRLLGETRRIQFTFFYN